MFYFLAGLAAANIALQLYDWWSTLKILYGADGKLGTTDDGQEVWAAPKFLMARLGVRPTIAALKVISIATVAALFLASQMGYIAETATAVGLAILLMFTVWVFARHNFRHDGI